MRAQQTWLPWFAFILVTWIVGVATGIALDRYAFPQGDKSARSNDPADDPGAGSDGDSTPSEAVDPGDAEPPPLIVTDTKPPVEPAVDPASADGVWAARHLFVAVNGQRLADTTRELFGTLKPGGVVLREGNLRDAAQTRALIREIKLAVGLGTGHADLPLIALEEVSNRLTAEGHPPIPTASAMGAKGDEEAARRAGEAFAASSVKWGVSVVFAPVLDVFESGAVFPDLETQSFGSNADVVARMGLALASGLESGGVLPVAKHFPGYGAASYDSQDGMLLVLDKEIYELAELTFPFSEAAYDGIPGIMVGHVAVPVLDTDEPTRPASLSPVMVRQLVREKWNYEGVVLADDVALNAAMRVRPVEQAVVQALAAGCDAVVFLDPDPARLRAACEAIARAVESGELSRKELDKSKRRLDGWLARLSGRPIENAVTTRATPVRMPVFQPSREPEPAAQEEEEATPVETVTWEPEPHIDAVQNQDEDPIEIETASPPVESAAESDPQEPPKPIEVANEAEGSPEPTVEEDTNPVPIMETVPEPDIEPVVVASDPEAVQEDETDAQPVDDVPEDDAPAIAIEETSNEGVTDDAEETAAELPPDDSEPGTGDVDEDAPSEDEAATEVEAADVEPAEVEPETTEVARSIPVQTRLAHLVQRDQTLEEVARFYGVSSADIEAWNDLSGRDVMWGTELEVYIPADELETVLAKRIVEGYVEPKTITHVVVSRDTLTSLAQHYDVQPVHLKYWNNLADGRLEAGTELKVLVIPEPEPEPVLKPEPEPETTGPEPPAPAFTQHRVKSGDTLRRIAERYGVTPIAIQELNNLKDPDHIWIGQRLKIPQQQ